MKHRIHAYAVSERNILTARKREDRYKSTKQTTGVKVDMKNHKVSANGVTERNDVTEKGRQGTNM